MPPIIVVAVILVLFFSVIIHEVSHGVAALRNGDETARLMGRLTLNPLPHIDPVGTVILPVILVVVNSPFLFGWAKPVPINPNRFRDYRRGMFEVGLSGPLSNIVLGLGFALAFRLGVPAAGSAVATVCAYAVFINFLLATFNLIPIPPLDGSRIVGSFLTPEQQLSYFRFERFGMAIIFGLILLTPLFSIMIALIKTLAEAAMGIGISV